jgi:hypothetical protein
LTFIREKRKLWGDETQVSPGGFEMDLYCAAVIRQDRVLALAVDEETELTVVSDDPEGLYARYFGAAHVYRLFPDFRGGQMVLTSRASTDAVGPLMPVRPVVMFSPEQFRSACEAVNAQAAEARRAGLGVRPPVCGRKPA